MRLSQDDEDRRPEEISGFWFFASLAAMLGLAGFSYSVCAAADPVFERAEAYFAESAREMLASGRFITPYYLNLPFFDKPILTYWAILASLHAFGATHLAARLPSVLAAVATAAITAYGATLLAGRRAGLMAGAVLCSSYLFGYFAMLCMADMWLTLFTTAGALLLLAGSLDDRHRGLDWWSASVCLALAMLTKGPVGLVVPVIAILAYLAFTRGLRQIRIRYVLAGLGTVCIVAGAWFFALWKENGTHALYAFFVVENLERFNGSAYRTHHWFGYIPGSFVVAALPWSILLPGVAWHSIRNWRAGLATSENRGERFLWCYLAAAIGFFSISRMQLDYYVLPALPAYAALTGIYLARCTTAPGRFVRFGGWVFAALLFLLGAAAAHYFWTPPVWSGSISASFTPVWFWAASAVMVVLLMRRRYLSVYALVFLAVCGGVGLAARASLPIYLRFLPVPDYARTVRQSSDGTVLAISSDLEPWRSEFAFQAARVPQLLDTESDFTAFLLAPGPRMALVTTDWIEKLPSDLASGTQIVSRRAGWPTKVTLGTALTPQKSPSVLKTFLLVTPPSSPSTMKNADIPWSNGLALAVENDREKKKRD